MLGVKRVSLDDNFFELGGHSLLAAQVFSRLYRNHDIQLPLRKMFEAPTPAGLARLVEGVRAAPERQQAARIPRRESAGPAPLSFMQQRLWLLEQLNPGLSVYNLPSAFRIRGRLDVDALERAVDEVVRRHEATRTVLRWEGSEPVQEVVPELEIRLTPVVDLSNRPGPQREAEVLELLKSEASRAFDLTKGPLVRGSLYRLGPEEHAFFWMPHHAVWDGWSFDVFLNELDLLYTAFAKGEPSPFCRSPFATRTSPTGSGPSCKGKS